MSERVPPALIAIAIGLALLWMLRRRFAFHLLTIFAVASTLVACYQPLATLWVEPITWRGIDRIPESILLAVQWEYVAFALGLLIAGALADAGREAPPSQGSARPRELVRQRDALVFLALLAGGALLYALYVRSVGVATLADRENYAEKYRVSAGLGPLAAGLTLMITACLWSEASSVGAGLRWLGRLCALAIAVWSIAVLHVRTNFVILALGYAYVACSRREMTLARVKPAMIALVACIWAGMEFFSLFRGAYSDASVADAVEWIAGDWRYTLACSVGSSELGHPFVTAMEVASARDPGELGGSSYVDALGALAPLALNPDRAPVLSQEFVQRFYPVLAAKGGGTAFSLVAEAWLNFGALVGPLVVGAAAGLLLARLERARSSTPDGLLARLAPSFVYFVVIAHRSESATLIKQALVVVAPAAVLWFVAEIVLLAAGRLEGPRRAIGAEGAG